MTNVLASKTYGLLIIFAVLALAVAILAAVAFDESLWQDWFDFLKVQAGVGGARAAINDGLPKVAAAWHGNTADTSGFSGPAGV